MPQEETVKPCGNGTKAVRIDPRFQDLDFLNLYEKKIRLNCNSRAPIYDALLPADGPRGSRLNTFEDKFDDFQRT